MAHTESPSRPRLHAGIPLASILDTGVLAGRVGDESVLLARLDDGLHAVGGNCTHYGGPLGEGFVAGDEARCPAPRLLQPAHRARAQRASIRAVVDLARGSRGDQAFVREKLEAAPNPRTGRAFHASASSSSVAAPRDSRPPNGCATWVTPVRSMMLSADSAGPYDRPNLSKDSPSPGHRAGGVDSR